jgi:hypothetical protein
LAYAAFDPVAKLSWLARRRWRRAERRVQRQFESETLAELRQLAADEALVSWTTVPAVPSAHSGGILGPVELSAGGRKIAAKAVWGPAWSSLSTAVAQGRVVLSGAGRYSGSWCLRFRVLNSEARTEREVPLLGAGLRIVPHWGGESGSLRGGAPLQPTFA